MPNPLTPPRPSLEQEARDYLRRKDVFEMRWHWADPHSPEPLSREGQEAKLLAAFARHHSDELEKRVRRVAFEEAAKIAEGHSCCACDAHSLAAALRRQGKGVKP